MTDLVVALGLLLTVEGVFYGGFPGAARRVAMQIAALPDQVIRTAGIIALAIGVFLVWTVRG